MKIIARTRENSESVPFLGDIFNEKTLRNFVFPQTRVNKRRFMSEII